MYYPDKCILDPNWSTFVDFLHSKICKIVDLYKLQNISQNPANKDSRIIGPSGLKYFKIGVNNNKSAITKLHGTQSPKGQRDEKRRLITLPSDN